MSARDKPGCEMKDIQKRSKGITGHVADLSLVHKRLVEEIRRILLLHFFLVLFPFAFPLGVFCLLLLHGRAGDVEPHFDKLIRARRGLSSPVLCAPCRLSVGSVRLGRGKGKLHRHLILSSQVGIGDFGVGHFESGSVLDIEGQLGLGELCITPVPSSQGVFAVLDVDAVPDFESLAQPFEVLAEPVSLSMVNSVTDCAHTS